VLMFVLGRCAEMFTVTRKWLHLCADLFHTMESVALSL
jgi:hypothetical protein